MVIWMVEIAVIQMEIRMDKIKGLIMVIKMDKILEIKMETLMDWMSGIIMEF